MVTTITISEQTKEMLMKYKGERSWDEFLRELAEILGRIKSEERKRKIKELERFLRSLSDDEIREIEKAIKVMRKWKY